tara:strand:- start:250 stop:354 length:105 start_codon:yes stop_codon:yes gene_type:complete
VAVEQVKLVKKEIQTILLEAEVEQEFHLLLQVLQ